LLIGSIDTPNDPVMNEVWAGTIIFLVVNMTKAATDFVVFLLRRSWLLALVAYLLRAFANHLLFLLVALTGNLLPLLYASLEWVLLTLLLAALLLPRPLLALLLRLGRSALRRLLGSALFVCSALSFRILCGLVLLVLIGHLSSPSWLRALQKPTQFLCE
jgi:hypothetical protein